MSELYHYTCDHGRAALGDAGTLLPTFMLTERKVGWQGFVVWLTDLDRPDVLGLGLTSYSIKCDRTQHRYRVTDRREVMPWVRYARLLRRDQREALESLPGARPAHWYVSVAGVPAVYDPIPAAFGAVQ